MILLWVSAALLASPPVSLASKSIATEAIGARDEVDVLFTGPRCLLTTTSRIDLIGELWDHFESVPGNVLVESFGMSALSDESGYLFPESGNSDVALVRHFLGAQEKYERQILAESLPILMSPNEITFQYPTDPHVNWLTVLAEQAGPAQRYPATQRGEARLIRFRGPDDRSVLRLELKPGGPLSPNVHHWIPQWSGQVRVQSPNRRDTLFALGAHLHRPERVVAELRALRARSSEKHLLLHPGNLVRPTMETERRRLCGEFTRRLNYDALVPGGSGELGMGPEALEKFAKQHHLPYIAANLFAVEDSDDEKHRLFPPFVLREIHGKQVAIIAAVSPMQLQTTPAAIRRRWRVTDPNVEIKKTLKGLIERLGRRPDLLIVLMNLSGKSLDTVDNVSFADILLGRFRNGDYRSFKRTVEVTRDHELPPDSHYSMAPLLVNGVVQGIGRVRVTFSPESGFARMRKASQESWGIVKEGPADPDVLAELRPKEEVFLARNAETMLPDPAAIISTQKDLHEYVWGDRVLYNGKVRNYPRAFPGIMSDLLWGRFVTNALLLDFDADVALSRNLTRRSSTVGSLQREMIDSWLTDADTVLETKIKGTTLTRMAQHIEQHRNSLMSGAIIHAAGLDSRSYRVRGRLIDPEQSYRVVLSDSALSLLQKSIPEFNGVRTYIPPSMRPNTATEEDGVSLRDAIFTAIDARRDPGQPMSEQGLSDLLLDYAAIKRPEWSLRIDEASLRASRYANGSNIQTFANTRETRLRTPNGYSVGARTNIALIYDSPKLAWENRVRTDYSKVVPGQEQADDIVLSSELRLNAIQLQMSDSGMPLVPFVQGAYDSEFSPTDLANSNVEERRQQIGRASIGVVLYPGPRLRELRFGGIAEIDFSDRSALQFEGGLRSSYKLVWSLLSRLIWESEMDVRFLFEDGDDDQSDLGLIVNAVNRLKVPINEHFAFFAFVDAFGARGKVPSTRAFSGSWIGGGGLDFSAVIR